MPRLPNEKIDFEGIIKAPLPQEGINSQLALILQGLIPRHSEGGEEGESTAFVQNHQDHRYMTQLVQKVHDKANEILRVELGLDENVPFFVIETELCQIAVLLRNNGAIRPGTSIGIYNFNGFEKHEKQKIKLIVKRGDLSEKENCLKSCFIVVEPKICLYPSYMNLWISCRRRLALSHYAKGPQQMQKQLTYGSAYHEYLSAIAKKEISRAPESSEYFKIYKRMLLDMYLTNISWQEFMETSKEALANINAWYRNFVESKNEISIGVSKMESSSLQIQGLRGSEISIVSKFFGLKGTIDLLLNGVLVQNRLNEPQSKTQVIVVFQLKSGTTPKEEHLIQLDTYMALARQKWDQPVFGILFYAKNSHTEYRWEKPSVVLTVLNLRNSLVSELLTVRNQLTFPACTQKRSECEKGSAGADICEYMYTCAIQAKAFRDIQDLPQVPLWNAIHAEISVSEVEYFKKWFNLLHLQAGEERERKNSVSVINTKFTVKVKALSVLLDSDGFARLKLRPVYKLKSIEQLYRVAEKLRIRIPSIEVEQTCKIVAILKTPRGDQILIQLCNKNVSHKTIKLKVSIDLSNETDRMECQLEKFDSSICESLRWSITNFLENGSGWLKELILGGKAPQLVEEMASTGISEQWKDLNEEQRAACLSASRMKKFLLIEGMPGTGKTLVIEKIVQYFFSIGQKVLVTCFTNRSLDNILERIHHSAKIPINNIIREGSRYGIDETLRHFCLDPDKLDTIEDYAKFYKQKRVWFVTTASMMQAQLNGITFDLAIIDEASQCLEPGVLSVMMRCKKWILVGDYKQLDPLVQSIPAREGGMSESLFERLCKIAPNYVRSLSIQYRMSAPIQKLSNTLFYNNRLRADSKNTQEQQIDLSGEWRASLTSNLQQILCPDLQALILSFDRLTLASPTITSSSLAFKEERALEAKICSFLYEFYSQRLSTKAIAVICALNSSVSAIIENLRAENLPEQSYGAIMTIDKAQGIDKDIVVLLIPRQKETRQLMLNPKRLNVALTRAKKKLIIVGSANYFKELSQGKFEECLSTIELTITDLKTMINQT